MLLGCAILAVAALESAVLAADPLGPLWALLLFPSTSLFYTLAGLVAWGRRPVNRLGPIMVAGSLVWLAAGLANVDNGVLVAVGQVLATVPLAVVVHLLLAFPGGRLSDTASRVTVAAGYGVALVLQAPLYMFAPAPPPYDVLQVAVRPELVTATLWTQRGAGTVVMVATSVILVRRVQAASRRQRRVLAPLYAYGVFAVLWIPVSTIALPPWWGIDPLTIAVSQLAVFAGIPIAFAFGVLRGGFAQTGAIEELAQGLGAELTARGALRDALADTLGDPSAELVFWIGARAAFVDDRGRDVLLPGAGSPRSAVPIELAGRRIGAISYDATLIADPEPVRAAGRVVAIAVDHERLTAELLASHEELRRSRARIAEAADLERRRIAQDLHDGIQGQLVVLALQAELVAAGPAAPESVRAGAGELRSGLDAVAADLRRLVHGVMPALLIERGLYAATEDLVDRLPLPAALDLQGTDHDLPASIAHTAYFVINEAVTNAIKHSHAHELSVRLRRSAGQLTVEVGDNGVGGAVPADGTGLRGLVDRLDVVGGRLSVDSPLGAGTRLRAEVPCGS